MLLAPTVDPTRNVIRHIRDEQLGARTPCVDYDVKALLNHLLYWGPSLVGAAYKKSVAPPAASEQDVDLASGDWAEGVEAHLDELVTAWSDPDAWEGVTQMGGPMKLPASMIGGMVLGEMVVHGWDLARATGQSPTWPDDVLEPVLAGIRTSAEQGRQMGVYGPEVPVSPDAPPLDRLLGLTGRNPAWSPQERTGVQ